MAGESTAQPSTWRAGAAEIDVTPPIGAVLAGYAHRTGGSTHIIDPLKAQCLVLQDGTDSHCALLTVDILGIAADVVREARHLISEQSGIPPERVLIACTHTHAGPAGPRGAFSDEGFLPTLPQRLAGLVRGALHNLRPARLAAGVGACDTVQLNRRDVHGPIDPEVAAVGVQDAETGALIAALINFACHPTILSGSQLGISPDWPGAARATVRTLCGPEAVVLCTNGACADINPTKLTEDPAEVRRVGTIVGATAARVLEELRALHGRAIVHASGLEPPGSPLGWGSAEKPAGAGAIRLDSAAIAASSRSVTLPMRAIPDRAQTEARITEARQQLEGLAREDPERRRQRFLLMRLQFERDRGPRPAGAREAEVQAICIGAAGCAAQSRGLHLGARLCLITAPGELFVEIGLGVKRAFAAAGAFPIVVGYANAAEGYLPTDDAFDWHGYEVGVSPFDRGTEPALRAAMLSAAAEALGHPLPAQ